MNEPEGVLVLGAGGFVGQHLLKIVRKPLYAISRSLIEVAPEHVHVFHTELNDEKALRCILPKCRWLVHLACDSTPGVSAANPMFEAEHNLLPSLQLLQLLHEYPAVNLIYLSSGGAIYGNATSLRGCQAIDESSAPDPLSYYAAGKAAIEAFVTALSHQSPRTAVILRPSNLYGPGQRFQTGFGLVPTILQLQSLGEPLHIWGDGENVRDYLYIDDLIRLIDTIIRHPAPLQGCATFNVGAGVGHSINELCRLLEDITSTPVVREYHPARKIDVRHIVLNSHLVQSNYPWKPETALLTGLKETWRWHSSDRLHKSAPES